MGARNGAGFRLKHEIDAHQPGSVFRVSPAPPMPTSAFSAPQLSTAPTPSSGTWGLVHFDLK